MLAIMSQKVYHSSLGVDCKILLLETAIIKNMRYHVKKLPLNCSCYPLLRVWSMDSCLTSPALSQVYLSLTFQLSQTAVVKVEMSSTFPTVPVKLSNSQSNFPMTNSYLCNESQKS